MKKISFKILFFAFVLSFGSCYYDSEEDLFPEINNDCNLENLSFSGDIVPILDNKCWSCHSNSTAASFGANIKLEDYTDVARQFDAVLGSVNHVSSYSPMPKNGVKLPTCELQKLETWNLDSKLDN